MQREELSFEVSAQKGSVSAVLDLPESPFALLVLAHGAGAGMRHTFMEQLSAGLTAQGVAVFRYQFAYMEAGSKRPDHRNLLKQTVAAAVTAARARCPQLPLFAGGKSLGGRMSSAAVADGQVTDLKGIVFFGFPLHPPDKPGTERADHLSEVCHPMLFLQGTRDKLADLSLLKPVCTALAERAVLHICEGADHGFAVLKRSGRNPAQVFEELQNTTVAWMKQQLDLTRG